MAHTGQRYFGQQQSNTEQWLLVFYDNYPVI